VKVRFLEITQIELDEAVTCYDTESAGLGQVRETPSTVQHYDHFGEYDPGTGRYAGAIRLGLRRDQHICVCCWQCNFRIDPRTPRAAH
jgi:hypothetical protein